MRKNVIYLFAILYSTLLFSACSSDDDDNTVNEYANWQSRNEVFFDSINHVATQAICEAQTTYGADWQQHCTWKKFLTYSYPQDFTDCVATDSIIVEVIEEGKGAGCPMSSDSCRLYYRGRLIPTISYAEGYTFDHSGQSTKYNEIFYSNTGVPSIFRPSSLIKGFGTALQQMHIGDLWRVYIPQQLGYQTTATSSIPAYSTLIFEIKLISYYRSGAVVPDWN